MIGISTPETKSENNPQSNIEGAYIYIYMILERGIEDMFLHQDGKETDMYICAYWMGKRVLFHKQHAFAIFFHDFFSRALRRAKEKKNWMGGPRIGWDVPSMAFKRDLRFFFFFSVGKMAIG